MFKSLISAIIFAVSLTLSAQENPTQWNTPGAGNPFIPGYFADPTIRKFGDTFYIYATTDGTGNGYGPAQVWMSKDFREYRSDLPEVLEQHYIFHSVLNLLSIESPAYDKDHDIFLHSENVHCLP